VGTVKARNIKAFGFWGSLGFGLHPVIPKTPLTQLGSWQNARATGGAGIAQVFQCSQLGYLRFAPVLPAANLRSRDHLKQFKK
jgi:hypothetical protein